MILFLFFFFFNDTATTEIYTLSLHDALPIYAFKKGKPPLRARIVLAIRRAIAMSSLRSTTLNAIRNGRDRKSTRLNSSHQIISYAVFCLKKKKTKHVKRVYTLCMPDT